MADMDAEEAFLKSMKEKAEAEGALYGTVGANAKQTESTSSDEYDPAQAVPETFSSHPAPDFSNRVSSPDIVKHNSPPQTQNRPSSAFANFAAATGLQDQAAGDDEDRSQSRSMSGSSSSASSVNIQTSQLRSDKGGSPRELSLQRGVLNGTSNAQGVESIFTRPASVHVPTSTFDEVAPENVPSHNSVSLSSHAVQNGVSHPVSDLASPALTSAGDATQLESAAQPASLPPNSKDVPVKSSVEDRTVSPVSVLPRARLPHDIIGILDDRVKEDPRGDMDAWLSLIAEYRKRGKTEEARAAYERFFGVFPSAAEQWVAYARMENELHNRYELEKIFQKTLLQIPNLQLWSTYLDHVRRINDTTTDASGDARQTITQAYELALNQVGLDKDSGHLWQDFIQFLKSRPGNIGGTTWQEQQKMDALRKAYHRAIKVPTQATTLLWKEYDQFEMNINKLTGRKFLQEESAAYMTARSSYIELSNMTRQLHRTTLPKLPPALGFDGDREFGEQLDIWKRWVQWEKDDPLVLKNGSEEEKRMYRDRVIFVYRQALMAMRFWPEMWFDAAEFCFQIGIEAEGKAFLEQGIAANPESCLLAFKLADHIELTTSNEEGDEGIVRRGAVVREPFDRVLDALYDLIAKTKAREAQEIARIEVQFTANAEQQSDGGKNDDDNENEDFDSEEKRKAAQIEAVKGVIAMQVRVISKTISFTWIALMRAMRRIQGKGKVNDPIGGSRQVFTDARKRGRILSDVYVASAMIEYHCYEPEATKKIFERGLKLFPEDEGFALEYIKHLIATNDHTNARVVFETVVNKFAQKPDTLPRTKPLYAFYHDFESRYGELAQVIKLEKRMKDHFPDDPLLSHFSRRFAQPGFDPTAIRPIISPATQARPKQVQSTEAPFPLQGSPPSQSALNAPPIFKTNSPKRPLPLEDSDNDSERPKKFARAERGESPQLKGAAGRRLDQQKRNQQSQGTPQFDQVLLQPPQPSLPRDIMFLLSILPNAKAYPPVPRFIPEKVIEHVRLANLQAARRVQPDGGPPPPQQQQRLQQLPPRIPQPMPLQNMPQMPPMQPISSAGMQNLYNGGYFTFPPVHSLFPSTPCLPQHFQGSIRSSSETMPAPYPAVAGHDSSLRSSGCHHSHGIAAPPSFCTSAIAEIPPSWRQQHVEQGSNSASPMTTAAMFRKLSEDLQKYQ